MKLNKKFGELFFILISLGIRGSLRLTFSKIFSLDHYYILGRSLTFPLKYPLSRKPDTQLSLLTDDDYTIIKKNLINLNLDDRREILARLNFYHNGFNNCYVIKSGNEIAYLQWIIFPTENHIIQKNYSNKFYPLTEKQVMIENVFIFPRFRGRGYLPFGTIQLLESAIHKGYASAICYIRKDRITTLNEFTRLGFKIVKLVREYRFMGKVWRAL